MTAALTIELVEGPLERVRADLVVVGWAAGDRPLRGAAARADWRLCGELWALCEGKLRGARGDALLLSGGGALCAPLLLALGLGERSELDVDRWRAIGEDAVERARGLRVERVALGLASDAAEAGTESLAALLCGAAQATAEAGEGLRALLIESERTALLVDPEAARAQRWPPGVEVRIARPEAASPA